MKRVFISGSIKIHRLNNATKAKLKELLKEGVSIVIGDAKGADTAVQRYLLKEGYLDVVVFCSGGHCRNNVGHWKVRHVAVDSNLRGKDFYTHKDKLMAQEADCGFVIWDGKSSGSFRNVLDMLKRQKPSQVYFLPENQFYTISTIEDAQHLLGRCDKISSAEIKRKTKMTKMFRDVDAMTQTSLGF